MTKDYYSILGVSPGADSATIQSAFRALARRYHPDAGKGSSATKFREVIEAYRTLSDPTRRRQHDIDLGRSIRRNVPAEPLFASNPSRTTSIHAAARDWDELLADLLRFIESDFDLLVGFPQRFY